MPTIEALPGRVILEFPPQAEKYKGTLYVPQTSQRRREFARLVHCGDATTPEEEVKRKAIIDADRRGLLFAIPVASGQYLYQVELEHDPDSPTRYGKEKDQDLGHLNFLKDVRTYAISQLHTVIHDPETLAMFKPKDE